MIKPHEQRVIDEKRDLDEKLAKLKAFGFVDKPNPIFCKMESIDRYLLADQYSAMLTYSEVLAKRIARFNLSIEESK